MLDRHVIVVTDHVDERRLRLTWACVPLLFEAGIRVLVHVDDPFQPGIPSTLARMLRSAPPAGVIVTSTFDPGYETELIEMLDEMNVPMVHVLGPEPVPAARTVLGDDAPGLRDLMAHLLDERGIRRPVIVRGPVEAAVSDGREELVRAELSRRGLPVDERLVIDGGFTRDAAHGSMAALLAERRDLDAVIALNDPSALGAWQALVEAGLRVPQDVLVTGVDNRSMGELHWPGLTTTDPDLEAQGELAVACLLRQIRGQEVLPLDPVPARLVQRGSTSRAANLGFDGVEAERDAAVAVARAAEVRTARQETLNGFREALMRCGSLAEVLGVVASTRFDLLGIAGYTLALYESPDGDLAPSTRGENDVRVLLQSWGGELLPTPTELQPVHAVAACSDGAALLVFQPLAGSDRALGYVAFELATDSPDAAEVLQMDLSRTLGAVLAGEELAEYARSLERQVNRRTQELEREVSTRRSTEDQLQRLNVELQRSLMIDGLTRIANRAAFQQHLERLGIASEERDVALLFVDVDLFKQYNDHYGHIAGDAALCQVAACLARATLYPDDLACRWGGEEFAALLPGSGMEGAHRVAERFAEMLHDAAIPHARSPVSSLLSASIGIAVTRTGPGLDTEALIAEADRALYRAKAEGRNRISAAGAAVPDPGRVAVAER